MERKLAILPVALSCFVMIIAQSAATSRVYAIRHQERVNENADILGPGGCKRRHNGQRGVRRQRQSDADRDGGPGGRAKPTRAACFLRDRSHCPPVPDGPLQYLPRCVLASIVFTIAVGMVDIKGLRSILQESRGEFMLATATAAAVVCVGVEQGILFAIGFSLVRHVRHSYEAHSMVLVPDASGRWAPAPAQPGLQTAAGLIVYRYGADLFYANADHFADEVRELVEKAAAPIQWLVFDAEAIGDVDLSAAQTIRSLLEDLNRKGVRVVFGRVNRYLLSDMRRHRIAAVIGDERISRRFTRRWTPSAPRGSRLVRIRRRVPWSGSPRRWSSRSAASALREQSVPAVRYLQVGEAGSEVLPADGNRAQIAVAPGRPCEHIISGALLPFHVCLDA